MSKKYVVELTDAQLSMLGNAMSSHSYDIHDEDQMYTKSQQALFVRTNNILMNCKTKAEYLRENRNAN